MAIYGLILFWDAFLHFISLEIEWICVQNPPVSDIYKDKLRAV